MGSLGVRAELFTGFCELLAARGFVMYCTSSGLANVVSSYKLWKRWGELHHQLPEDTHVQA